MGGCIYFQIIISLCGKLLTTINPHFPARAIVILQMIMPVHFCLISSVVYREKIKLLKRHHRSFLYLVVSLEKNGFV